MGAGNLDNPRVQGEGARCSTNFTYVDPVPDRNPDGSYRRIPGYRPLKPPTRLARAVELARLPVRALFRVVRRVIRWVMAPTHAELAAFNAESIALAESARSEFVDLGFVDYGAREQASTTGPRSGA